MAQAHRMENGSSRISQVTFFISDFFPSGQDLPVQYKLSGKWKPTPSDWIGLFRSNEDDVNKYVTYEWSRSPKRNLVDDAVTLETIFQEKIDNLLEDAPNGGPWPPQFLFPPAKTLPQDGAIYQFYYVTKQGNVRGRSVPFTIGKQKIASSEPDESDSEFVLVENSFAFLEKTKSEMEEIKKENCLLLKRIEESEEESRTSKALLGLAEGRVKEMEAALQSHQDAQVFFKKKEAEVADLRRKLTQESTKKKKLVQDREELRRHYEEQSTSFKDQIKSMEQENEKAMVGSLRRKVLGSKLAHPQSK